MTSTSKDKVTSLRGDPSFLVQYANATDELSDECVEYLTSRSIRKTYFALAAYRYDAGRDELLIPYPTAQGEPSDFGRRRVFAMGSKIKFRQDKGSGNHFYYAPIPERFDLDWVRIVSDPTIPMFGCEGELKAAAVAQYGHAAIALSGAYSWLSDKRPINDFDSVEWRRRELTIITDADAQTNRNVQAACVRLAEELIDRGADVRVWTPAGLDVDDLIAAEGIRKVRATIKRERIGASEIRDWGLTDQQPTDTGAGNVFVELHRDSVRHCPERRCWLIRDGHLWREDRCGAAAELGKATAREMQRQALRMPSGEDRKKRLDHAVRRENMVPLKNMLEAASTHPDVVVRGVSLDSDPNYVGVANGIIDLSARRLQSEPRADQYITKSLGVAYDDKAKTPRRFLKFLDEIFASDKRLIRYVQKSVGYALSGSPIEQKFFIWVGSGSNGKSTLVSTLQALMGDYATATPAESLLVKSYVGTGATPELVRLQGARMVIAAETEERQLAESLIKQLTGGDTITARPLYQDYVEFKPMFSMFLVCNHLPRIKGTEHAIWRRVAVVPFNVTVKEKNQDPKLLSKLLTELPGILRWAMEGHQRWQKESLGICPAVSSATASYRSEMDVVSQFIDECCVVEPGATVSIDKLYRKYRHWCEQTGWKNPMTKNRLSRRLTDKGFKAAKSGDRLRQGLTVKLEKFEEPGE